MKTYIGSFIIHLVSLCLFLTGVVLRITFNYWIPLLFLPVIVLLAVYIGRAIRTKVPEFLVLEQLCVPWALLQ